MGGVTFAATFDAAGAAVATGTGAGLFTAAEAAGAGALAATDLVVVDAGGLLAAIGFGIGGGASREGVLLPAAVIGGEAGVFEEVGLLAGSTAIACAGAGAGDVAVDSVFGFSGAGDFASAGSAFFSAATFGASEILIETT